MTPCVPSLRPCFPVGAEKKKYSPQGDDKRGEEKMKAFLHHMHGWYVSFGNWLVEQVDTNDYLAGFIWGCAVSMMYFVYFK
jgi:hypothetical protein